MDDVNDVHYSSFHSLPTFTDIIIYLKKGNSLSNNPPLPPSFVSSLKTQAPPSAKFSIFPHPSSVSVSVLPCTSVPALFSVLWFYMLLFCLYLFSTKGDTQRFQERDINYRAIIIRCLDWRQGEEKSRGGSFLRFCHLLI